MEFPQELLSLICHRKKKKAENIQLKHLAHAEDKIQSNKFYLFFFPAHLIVFQNGSKRIKDTF